jgi:hypothetical protein
MIQADCELLDESVIPGYPVSIKNLREAKRSLVVWTNDPEDRI